MHILQTAGNIVETVEVLPPELNFNVSTQPAYTHAGKLVKGVKLIVRDDTDYVLGSTGVNYTPYQNQELWSVVGSYCKQTKGTLDRFGMFGNGRFAWCTVKHTEYEILSGDPIIKYDMFINPFKGNMSVTLINTDVRVVCGNALTSALRNSSNVYRIRHAKNVDERVKIAIEASAVSMKAREKDIEYLTHLANTPITHGAIVEMNKRLFDVTETPSPRKLAKVESFNNLIESGLGADLKGVRGTAYGYLQAAIEFADHNMCVKSDESSKMESTLMGGIAEFKQKAGRLIYEYAISA